MSLPLSLLYGHCQLLLLLSPCHIIGTVVTYVIFHCAEIWNIYKNKQVTQLKRHESVIYTSTFSICVIWLAFNLSRIRWPQNDYNFMWEFMHMMTLATSQNVLTRVKHTLQSLIMHGRKPCNVRSSRWISGFRIDCAILVICNSHLKHTHKLYAQAAFIFTCLFDTNCVAKFKLVLCFIQTCLPALLFLWKSWFEDRLCYMILCDNLDCNINFR